MTKGILIYVTFSASFFSTVLGERSAKTWRANDLDNLQFFESHIVPFEGDAKGIQILFSDIAKPGVPLTQPAWTKFCSENKFDLVSVGFRPQDGVRNRNLVASELAALLEEAIENQSNPRLPRIGYAQSFGAEWFLRILQHDPAAWQFWAVKGAKSYPLAPRGIGKEIFPPGLIMNEDTSSYRSAREYFFDIRKIDLPAQKVAFVGSERRLLDSVFLDRFYRQYVAAVYSGNVQGSGLWLGNIASEREPAEGKNPWFFHSWLPNQEIAGAWTLANREEPPSVNATSETISFETEYGDDKLEVRTPSELVEFPERPVPTVLLWLTREPETLELSKRILNQNDPLIRFVELNRIPLIAWDARKVWPGESLQVAADVEEAMVAGADQIFIQAGDAMMTAAKRHCRERGWPDAGWLLAADDVAGRYGLMMAQAYPFRAVQLHSATGYERMPNPPNVPWLISSGWSDGSAAETYRFSRKAMSEGMPVMYKRYPQLVYRWRPDQRTLAAKFFEHVMAARKPESVYPWIGDWDKPPLPEEYHPVEVPVEGGEEGETETVNPEFPEDFVRGDYAPLRPKPVTPGEMFAESLRRAYLVGDWRRGELHENDELSAVPSWWRERLPSWEIAEAWNLTQGEFPELNENDQAALAKFLGQGNDQSEDSDQDEKESTEKVEPKASDE